MESPAAAEAGRFPCLRLVENIVPSCCQQEHVAELRLLVGRQLTNDSTEPLEMIDQAVDEFGPAFLNDEPPNLNYGEGE